MKTVRYKGKCWRLLEPHEFVRVGHAFATMSSQGDKDYKAAKWITLTSDYGYPVGVEAGNFLIHKFICRVDPLIEQMIKVRERAKKRKK